MDISVTESGPDFATVKLTYGQDDYVNVSGYGGRGGISVAVSLFAPEAGELVSILAPIANAPVGQLAPDERDAVCRVIETLLADRGDAALEIALEEHTGPALRAALARLRDA